jgi:tetratricopeptide (TPR) repeat protein
MKSMTIRKLLIAMLALLLVLPTLSQAKTDDDSSSKSGKKKSSRWTRSEATDKGWVEQDYFIDERTGKRLLATSEALADDDYDGAEVALDRLRMRNLNPLEKSRVYTMRAYIENGRENPAGARAYFEKAIGERVLDPDDTARLRLQVAQLWFSEEKWKEGAEALEYWFTIAPKTQPAHSYLLALAYYQLEDYEKSLVRAQETVDRADEPREGWLQLLLSLRLTLRQYEEAVPILEELVLRFPKKSYWLSLSTVHGALGNYEEALVPLQLAHDQKLLTQGSEVKRLAQLMLFLGLPFRAAQILQEGLEAGVIEDDPQSWEMLSNSWIGARDYESAAQPLERAAELSEDGSLYIRLAQVHIQREKWRGAQRALKLGIDKGLEQPGEAYLLMGITLHRQKRPEQARSWFARALRQKGSREEASTWITFIDHELSAG